MGFYNFSTSHISEIGNLKNLKKIWRYFSTSIFIKNYGVDLGFLSRCHGIPHIYVCI